jgi:hypothetical protein
MIDQYTNTHIHINTHTHTHKLEKEAEIYKVSNLNFFSLCFHYELYTHTDQALWYTSVPFCWGVIWGWQNMCQYDPYVSNDRNQTTTNTDARSLRLQQQVEFIDWSNPVKS